MSSPRESVQPSSSGSFIYRAIQTSNSTTKQMDGSLPSFGTPNLVPVDNQQGQTISVPRERFFAIPVRPLVDPDTIKDRETSRDRYSSPSFDQPIDGWVDPPNEKLDCQTSWFDHEGVDYVGHEPTWSEYMQPEGLAEFIWEEREEKKMRRRKTRNVKHWIQTGNPLGTTNEASNMRGSSSASQLTTDVAPSVHTSSQSRTPTTRPVMPGSSMSGPVREDARTK